MDKYVTSNSICEMFHITKRTLIRWEEKTPWGIPFPSPVFGSNGGAKKMYLATDVIKWELACQKVEKELKAI